MLVPVLLQPLQARPSNQEKNILEGKEAPVSGVRLSTCSSRSMYLGFASLKKFRKKTATTMGSWRVKVMKGIGKLL